jgi:hypothetical protein
VPSAQSVRRLTNLSPDAPILNYKVHNIAMNTFVTLVPYINEEFTPFLEIVYKNCFGRLIKRYELIVVFLTRLIEVKLSLHLTN